ncbi:WbuC family cupin fold metalloprotein, partial [Enterobacter hormaechei]|uniref:WbuC family cupin fold metalloprotein n=1 Tax=Enterobacter hormaechei TaxID=158836 RepID=UPI00350FBC05
MKSLFKVTLLATTMAVALNAPLSFAADTAAKPAATTDSKAAFKNDDQKSAYALGASLGRYMEPGTYVRPHRHPHTFELLLPLRGRFVVLNFDDRGTVT